VAELLGKSINQHALDQDFTKEDLERLSESLREWGALDKDMKYAKGLISSEHRGFQRPPGGGVNGAPLPSTPSSLHDILDTKVWRQMSFFMNQEFQTTMFQPVGGMGMIGKAFARQVAPMITYGAKVTKLVQGKAGVDITYTDMTSGQVKAIKADYCVCTIPLGVLNQVENNFSPELSEAISAVPYTSAVKIGLEMKRRFWEEDDFIYGGHSFTNQEISLISYPNFDFFAKKPGVLLGACLWHQRAAPHRHDARTAHRDRAGAGQRLPPQSLPRKLHERRFRGLEPGAVDDGLLRAVDRRNPRQILSDAGAGE
jgi:monoamine oxidase